MAILLKNATFINWENLEFRKTNLWVEEGKEGGITFFDELPAEKSKSARTTIDCSGKLVTRSFAIGHHHVYSAMAKGMPPPKKSPEDFTEILRYIWWTLDKCLDHDTIRYSALVTAMAAAKAGSTFVIDHHASPHYIEGALDIIAEAFEEVGIGHLLCYEATDRDGMEKAEKGLQETERYLKNRQGLVGLHASFTVSDPTLEKALDLMQRFDTGVHMHAAEGLYDQEHCLEHYNKRVVHRLLNAGALNSSKSILVHCLHLDEQEREILRELPCRVVQNMESNLKNKVGYFNGARLGNNIMLGTDGMHSDMLQSAKAAFFVGQNFDMIDFSSAYQRFRHVHHYLKENKFKGDGDNNLVILDYDSPTEVNPGNFTGHFIFGLNSNHVKHVISDGRIIVKDREIQTVNQQEILEESRVQAKRLWKKMQKVNP